MTSKLWLYKAKDANCKDNIARKTELVDIREEKVKLYQIIKSKRAKSKGQVHELQAKF